MEDKLGLVVLVCVLVFTYVYFFRPELVGMFTKVDNPTEIKTSTTISSTTTTTVSIEELSACPIDDLKKIIQESAQTRRIETPYPDISNNNNYRFWIPVWKPQPDNPAALNSIYVQGFQLVTGYGSKCYDGVCVECRFGKNVGEYTYYLYCETSLVLRKDIITNGLIQAKIRKEVNKIVLNLRNDFEVIEINCIDI